MPSPILTSITATWTTGFSDELWEKLDGLKHGASKDGDVLILGPTLPDEEEDRTANLVASSAGRSRWSPARRATRRSSSWSTTPGSADGKGCPR